MLKQTVMQAYHGLVLGNLKKQTTYIQNYLDSWTPVVHTTQEAEIRRIAAGSQPRLTVRETLS
jgi:hypothetical protein